MKFGFRLISASALLGAITMGASASVLIDDFTTGAQDLQIVGGTGSLEGQASGGSILGSERDVLLNMSSNPFNRNMRFEAVPGQGMAFFSTGSGVIGALQLDYDGTDSEGNDGVQTASSGGLNQNFIGGGDNAFSFRFEFSDSPVTVSITAETYGGGTSTSSFVAGASNTAVDYLQSFSSFSGSADFSDIDRLVIRFTPMNQAPDFAISRIAAVPEPASMCAIAFGLAGIVARRRKRA